MFAVEGDGQTRDLDRRAVSRTLALLLAPRARPLRFVLTGGTAGMVQLVLLALLMRFGWNAMLANGAAFLLAAQVNFALSVTLTWRDRSPANSLIRSWLLFHASIALMAAVNMLTFAGTHSVLPALAASLAGIGAGAVGNYLAGDRLVFRETRASRSERTAERIAA